MSNDVTDHNTINRDRRAQVRSGYDRMAEHYLASKEPLDEQTRELLEKLIADVPSGGCVLDLGCGAGVPVTQWLAQRRPVVGVDLSRRQLELARQHVPGARLIQADMSEIDFAPGAFGAVIAMYAIIHVPREKHGPLLKRLHSWLQPGGRFLATWPLTEWEGEEADWSGWGATMWWSHFGRSANLAMIASAGFEPDAVVDRRGAERWLWILAKKPG